VPQPCPRCCSAVDRTLLAHVALVAEHDGLAVGVAAYEILSSAQAEIAVLVDDAWQAGRRNLPVYELPEDAVRALGHGWSRRWLGRGAGRAIGPGFGPGPLGEPSRGIAQAGRLQRPRQIGDLGGQIPASGFVLRPPSPPATHRGLLSR
jgi:hypothetical protein